VSATIVCANPKCGAEVLADKAYCPECGREMPKYKGKQADPAADATPQMMKTMMYIPPKKGAAPAPIQPPHVPSPAPRPSAPAPPPPAKSSPPPRASAPAVHHQPPAQMAGQKAEKVKGNTGLYVGLALIVVLLLLVAATLAGLLLWYYEMPNLGVG
jgi:hypothetical protein